MSVRITKKGLLDTIQDHGRYGYQQLGINPGGVMDRVAATVANMLVDNEANETVVELHFPASSFLFEVAAIIALSGADFGAMINKQPAPLNTALIINENALLEFTSLKKGARCYLAVHGGWHAENWLGSCSTNLRVNAGGHHGMPLKKDDTLTFNKIQEVATLTDVSFVASGIAIDISELYPQPSIRVVKGIAFEQLSDASRHHLYSSTFSITSQSDRMGYRLQGEALPRTNNKEMLSSAVTRGTIQLLPSGQLIVLMADHQTTGGYPVVAHVISADLPTLAQKSANEKINFKFETMEEAELALLRQENQLDKLGQMLRNK